MTRYLATWCNMLQEELSAWAQPEVTFKPPLEGKIMLLDNMKHTKRTKQNKKKGQCSIYQAYEVLHEYIDISTFLEKLLRVILFLIIPIDSVKYLVSFILIISPISDGPPFFFFLFLETALKVQNTNTDRSMQHLHTRLHGS